MSALRGTEAAEGQGIMEQTRKYEVGTHVIYIDEHRQKHEALVTTWWGTDAEGHLPPGQSWGQEPGCNLLFVVGDASKTDPYGRQIERQTSLCHVSANPAGARCWAWPGEVGF